MAKQFFSDLPDTTTPLISTRLNGLLDGEEPLGNIVVDSIRSKNIFNYKIGSFEHAGADVSLLDNGIKVTVNDSNSTFPRANYFILDISNHLGENITLTSTIDINSTAHPRIAIGTCDSIGGNRTILSYTDTETNGRKSVTTTLPTSVTPNTRYMFIGFYCSHGTTVSSGNYVNFTNIQLEFGSISTTYYPYQELNNQETYSTSEIKIGTWVNGKPIYRKVIEFGNLPNATTGAVSHGISNYDEVITLKGMARKNELRFPIPQATLQSSQGTFGMWLGSVSISIKTSTDMSTYTALVIIEYTKTTD